MALKKWNTNFRVEYSVQKNRRLFRCSVAAGNFPLKRPKSRAPFTFQPDFPEMVFNGKQPVIASVAFRACYLSGLSRNGRAPDFKFCPGVREKAVKPSCFCSPPDLNCLFLLLIGSECEPSTNEKCANHVEKHHVQTLRQRCSRRERRATILRLKCKVLRNFRPLFFVFTTYVDANLKDLFEYFKMKYILVTGGVISGIGKGVISSSIGALLKGVGLHVTSIKIDPYLNIDAGTFSPYEHGKVNNYCFPLAFYTN